MKGSTPRRERKKAMKAALIFTGSGPIVVLTSYEAFNDPLFIKKMDAKGIRKFIAYEIDLDSVQKKYGKHFEIVMGDLHQTNDLRVLDYDGHHIFRLFTLSRLSSPIYHDPTDVKEPELMPDVW